MSLQLTTKLVDVKSKRADQRLTDLQQCRRRLKLAEQALADAEAEVEAFKRSRSETMQSAYSAIRGEDLSESDLRNLNDKLDKLREQEQGLVMGLDRYRQDIAEAEEQLRQATLRFHLARRNREKWESMMLPMIKAAKRDAERSAELERDEQAAIVRQFGH